MGKLFSKLMLLLYGYLQVKGGAAETDGRLITGDQILTVNGEDFREATQQYAAELLKVISINRSYSLTSVFPCLHHGTHRP